MKLTKIRLINWYHLENETINIHQSTLLSGENGCGKSTILDAILYALTTKTTFNKAANGQSNRTLEGYVRCKLGVEGREFKRTEKEVISYIGLQIYDQNKEEFKNIIVRMIAFSERGVDSAWAFTDCALEDINFILNKKPVKDLRDINGNVLKFIKSKTDAQVSIKFNLGRLDSIFFELLQKTLAFRPVDKVSKFINDYLLQADDINVDNLRIGINAMKQLELRILEEEERLIYLERIIEHYDNYQSISDTRDINKILSILLDMHINSKEADELNSQSNRLNQIISDGRKSIIVLEKERDLLYNKIRLIDDNEVFKLLGNLQNECKQKKQVFEVKKNDCVKLHKNINHFDSTLVKTKLRTNKMSLEDELENITDKSDKTILVSKLFDKLRSKKNELEDESAKSRMESQIYSDKLSKLNNIIRKLNKNEFTYGFSVEKLKNAIEERFSEEGIESDVYIFCELLEVVDDAWCDAVEGYIGSQKFNLIVEPKYYNLALKVYESFDKAAIYGVGIVNTSKMTKRKVVDNSLYYKLSAKNNDADRYLNYITGDVVCCEDVISLENYAKSITATCMKYTGYVASRINKKAYENPFIGSKAVCRQLLDAEKNRDKILAEISKLDSFIKVNKEIQEDIKIINERDILEMINVFEELQDVQAVLINIKNEIIELEKNPDLLSMSEKKRKYNKELQSISERLEESNSEVIKYHQENGVACKDLENTMLKIGVLKIKIKDYKLNDYATYILAENSYDLACDNLNIESHFRKINRNLSTVELKLADVKNELLRAQEKYITKFNSGYSTGIENVQKFVIERNRIKNDDIIAFKNELGVVRNDCEGSFRIDFLSKIKRSIEGAEQRFKKLNDTLKSITFGEESYKFKYSPREDRKSLYKMIKDEGNIGVGLFEANFDADYKEEISDLFSKISSDDNGDKNAIADYTDYRNYLSYDIEILKDNSKQLFSKICREKSGGETQNPFYVIMAAAFNQIYDDDTIRILLLDEAFDKMDYKRIPTMMEFFNKLGFQVILAAPEKIDVLYNYVETVLLVEKRSDVGHVIEFTHKEI